MAMNGYASAGREMDDAQYQSMSCRYRQGCVFCDPDPALVVASGNRFGVCFDVAPLTPGHVIIHAREHHGCAGEVPREQFDELDQLRKEVASSVRSVYGSVTFYEHGRAGHCLSDGPEHRLCHHFHLHCVPGTFDVAQSLARRFTQLRLARYADLPDTYESYGDYLYLEDDEGMMSYFVIDVAIERHLMRTVLSEEIGCPERADWRAYRTPTMLLDGMTRLGNAFLSRGA